MVDVIANFDGITTLKRFPASSHNGLFHVIKNAFASPLILNETVEPFMNDDFHIVKTTTYAFLLLSSRGNFGGHTSLKTRVAPRL